MVINVIQTQKYFYTSSFSIVRDDGKILGKVDFKDKSIMSKTGMFEISYNGKHYNLKYCVKPLCLIPSSKLNHPYNIFYDDKIKGKVYQTKTIEYGADNFEYYQMEYNDDIISFYPVFILEKGRRCPVYCNQQQIAEIDTDTVIYNDLHSYKIYATTDISALISVIFSLYMFVLVDYVPGRKVTKAKKTFLGQTQNIYLLGKYKTYFKKLLTTN